ncbi:Mast/stem cell growth factor receptor kita [Orchesella cincta]|uniref:Mast/stem cell growth factor receptor kita n=1 Tax=Orchesella cincta TaxID=48709 RepID=A0A1D2MXD9_ORCCI|nr:Mast/stem cell growth factor receptor kita [Orchesella cincta]
MSNLINQESDAIRMEVRAYEVELYTGIKFQGSNTTVNITNNNECVNLPEEFVGRIQSTKIQNCTQYYGQSNCTGINIQLSQNSHERRNLKTWNFHNRTESMGVCHDPCIPELGHSVSKNRTLSITLYTLPFFQGRAQTVHVNGCTQVHDNQVQKYGSFFYETFQSIFVPKGECVLAIFNNDSVYDFSIPEDCTVKPGQVVEFRDGEPQLYFLTWWPPVRAYYVRAFSPCQCKFYTDSNTLGILDLLPDEKFTVLFSEFDFLGDSHKIVPDSTELTCTDVEQSFVNRTRSVGTTHKCLNLFDGPNCTGKSILLSTRSPYKHDLRNWGFDYRIQSISVCNSSCLAASNDVETKLIQPKPINIKYYLETFMQGDSYDLEVDGCTPVNTEDDKILSIRIPEGACVLAFLDEMNVKGNTSIHNCSDEHYNVLQLWNGLPALNDFREWYSKWKEYIVAFSPCHCNYNPFLSSSDSLNGSYITLFLDKFFMGSSINIELNFTGCNDFATNEELSDWEGLAKSLKVSNRTCVRLYKEHGCESPSFLEVTASIADLSMHNFELSVRSLALCASGIDNANEQRDETNTGKLPLYLIPIGCVTALVCVMLAAFLIHMRRRALKLKNDMKEMLSNKEIDEFLKGFDHDNDGCESEADIGNETSQTCSSELLAQNQPYSNELEILSDQLQFDIKSPIGTGEFGLVYQGTLILEDNVQTVAIKTTKPFASAQGLRVLMKEVKVMMYVGKCPQIVALVGCCTANIREGELLVVLEYCDNGSLEKYLRKNQSHFVNILQKTETDFQNSYCTSEVILNPKSPPGNYVSYMPALDASFSQECQPESFDIYQLITWSIEIAQGMEFLASKKGILNRGEETLSVAIKTTKHLSASKGLRSLLKEVKIMMYVGQHSKIVTLIGCCTGNLREGELLIVMEYCEHGSLEKYLKANKSKFINLCSHGNGNRNAPKSIRNTEYVSKFETSESNADEMSATHSSVSMEFEANSFTARQLISWSIEIAEGMDYKIMYSCWEKDPKRRPTFPNLQSRLRQIETNVTSDNIAEYEGTLNVDDTVLPVAVKTTKTQSNAQNLRSLLKEVKIMLYVGKHSNIVTLLGCCTTNLHEGMYCWQLYQENFDFLSKILGLGELLIVMELCSSGSLDGYLKDNRANFVNFVQKGQLRVPKKLDALYSEANSQSANSTIYVKSIPGLNFPVSEASATDTVFSIHQLIEWSIEIADGMTYLSSKRLLGRRIKTTPVVFQLSI